MRITMAKNMTKTKKIPLNSLQLKPHPQIIALSKLGILSFQPGSLPLVITQISVVDSFKPIIYGLLKFIPIFNLLRAPETCQKLISTLIICTKTEETLVTPFLNKRVQQI
jgi:hypothetical protein